jgi:hypothetical protein
MMEEVLEAQPSSDRGNGWTYSKLAAITLSFTNRMGKIGSTLLSPLPSRDVRRHSQPTNTTQLIPATIKLAMMVALLQA